MLGLGAYNWINSLINCKELGATLAIDLLCFICRSVHQFHKERVLHLIVWNSPEERMPLKMIDLPLIQIFYISDCVESASWLENVSILSEKSAAELDIYYLMILRLKLLFLK